MKKRDQQKLITASVAIPSEAMGRVIGQGGSTIKFLRSFHDITSVNLLANGLNENVCEIKGKSEEAIHKVVEHIEEKLLISRRSLHNNSRKVHSWIPTDSGRILTPREVHRKKVPKPKKGSKEWLREEAKIKGIREDIEIERRKNTF